MSYGSPYASASPYQQSDPSSSYMMPPNQGIAPPFMPDGSYMMQPGFQGVPPPYYGGIPPPESPESFYPPPPPPRQQQQRRRQAAAPQVNVQKIQKLTINKPVQRQQQRKQQQQKVKNVPCRRQQDYTKAFQNMRLRSLPPSPDDRDPVLTLYDRLIYIFPQSYLRDFMENKNQVRLDNKYTDKAAAFRMDDGSFMLMFSSVRDKNGSREFMPVRIYYNHGPNA